MATDATDHADHQPHVNSMAIFIALCICTVISVAFDIVDMNRQLVAILVLAVAVAKAQFVMRYFMHLKFEGRWKYVVLLPTAILACGLPLALAPDIAMHYYKPDEGASGAGVGVHGESDGYDDSAGGEHDGHQGADKE